MGAKPSNRSYFAPYMGIPKGVILPGGRRAAWTLDGGRGARETRGAASTEKV